MILFYLISKIVINLLKIILKLQDAFNDIIHYNLIILCLHKRQ